MLKTINIWAFDTARPLNEVFAIAKDSGFSAVEVAIAEDGPITPQTTADECKHILDLAEDAGITINSMASGGGWSLPISCTDEATRRKGIAFIDASLRVAKNLNLDTILVVPGGVGADFIPGFKKAPYDIAYNNAKSALQELKAAAEETQVSIGIENVWNKFLLSPLEMRQFIDDLGSDYIGSYFDVGNVIATGYPEQWIRILGNRIKKVHFKDFKSSVGTLDGFCDLLDGDVDYAAVMEALREIGYDGPVAAEFFDCEEDLPKISAAMDQILAM